MPPLPLFAPPESRIINAIQSVVPLRPNLPAASSHGATSGRVVSSGRKSRISDVLFTVRSRLPETARRFVPRFEAVTELCCEFSGLVIHALVQPRPPFCPANVTFVG